MNHEPSLRLLRVILGFTILSTLIHYTHNFIAIDQYPRSDLVGSGETRVGIVISWPLFTIAGMIGYRWFAARRFPRAQFALLAYAPVGLLTLGHFIDGNPQIPAFFYATLFSDAIGAIAVIAFAVLSLRSGPSGGFAARRTSRRRRGAG